MMKLPLSPLNRPETKPIADQKSSARLFEPSQPQILSNTHNADDTIDDSQTLTHTRHLHHSEPYKFAGLFSVVTTTIILFCCVGGPPSINLVNMGVEPFVFVILGLVSLVVMGVCGFYVEGVYKTWYIASLLYNSRCLQIPHN